MSGAAASAPDPRLEMGVNVFHYKNTLAYYENGKINSKKTFIKARVNANVASCKAHAMDGSSRA
jgi:hypothetical protein